MSTKQASFVKQHKSMLENFMQNSQDSFMTKKTTEDLFDNSASGKVRNLKKEFEAKSENIEIVELSKPNKNRVSSLPSSPVSVHVSKDKRQQRDEKSTSEDINLRNLIGIFENKDDSHVNRRHKSLNSSSKPFTQNRNTRFSCIEVSTNKTPRFIQTPTISLLNKTMGADKTNESDCRRPPIVPTVRNPTQGVQGLMVAATVINAAKKKEQQFGKSHPLAKLNIKPRHNNPVYNTM